MINKLYQRYDAELKDILEGMKKAFSMEPCNEEMGKVLNEICDNPGKMLRPILMLLIAGECGEQEKKELISTATAMEIIHNSSLVLDDMLDEAPVRRNKPTVVARYKAAGALCVGDFALSAAYRYLHSMKYFDSAMEICDVTQKACNGEMIQNLNRGNPDISEETYFEAIKGKTAVLFRTVCESACRITKKDEAATRDMGELGEILGIIFQLRDDVLDWTCKEKDLGKPVNEDFSEGIYTLPAIFTFKDPVFGDELKRIANKRKKDTEDVERARELVQKSGGIKYTKDYISDLAQKAEKLVESLSDETSRLYLREIVTALK